MPKDLDFVAAVKAQLKAMDWTPYRLGVECRPHITMPTIYSFLEGKPVKSDSLAIILHAVNLTISKGSK